eukprot:12691783-Alexandrium_andersonii.AAC.1
MSASLVGSEMCIRDSLRGSAGGGARVLLAFVAWCPCTCVREAPVLPSQPVSYTHLTLPTICSV